MRRSRRSKPMVTWLPVGNTYYGRASFLNEPSAAGFANASRAGGLILDEQPTSNFVGTLNAVALEHAVIDRIVGRWMITARQDGVGARTATNPGLDLTFINFGLGIVNIDRSGASVSEPQFMDVMDTETPDHCFFREQVVVQGHYLAGAITSELGAVDQTATPVFGMNGQYVVANPNSGRIDIKPKRNVGPGRGLAWSWGILNNSAITSHGLEYSLWLQLRILAHQVTRKRR